MARSKYSVCALWHIWVVDEGRWAKLMGLATGLLSRRLNAAHWSACCFTEMCVNKRISHVARTIRIARGLSVYDVAQRAGIDHSTVTALEVGRNGWTTESILAVAGALGVRPAILLMSREERLRAQEVL